MRDVMSYTRYQNDITDAWHGDNVHATASTISEARKIGNMDNENRGFDVETILGLSATSILKIVTALHTGVHEQYTPA